MKQELKRVNEIKNINGWELMVGAGCVCVVALMFYRCFFGTALVDEAYYVSDSLAMLHGNLPYAYNWFSGCGMDFLLIPPLFIYECLVPDLSGVLLLTRICFVAFRMGILLLLFIFLRKRLERIHALLLLGAVVPFYGGVIQNFSYNTIPIWMGVLTGILLGEAKRNEKYNTIKYLAAGFCSAIGVFAHPIYVATVIIFICLIAIYDRKLSSVLWYMVGGTLEILMVFIPLMTQSGISKLLDGMIYILNSHVDKGSSLVSSTPVSRIIDVLRAFYLFWFTELVVYIVVNFLTDKVSAKSGKSIKKESKHILAAVCATGAGVMAVIVLNDFDLNAYCSLGAVGSMGFLLLLGEIRKRQEIIYIGLPPLLFVWGEVILTGSNGGQIRFYSCAICFIAILWSGFADSNKTVRLAATILSLVVAILQCYIDFNYIYRDAPFENLKYRVESGVYKGIYTNADRAEDLPELEWYLDQAVDDQELVAFRDNAPCAYLMKNQNICDVWTWDTLQYERGNKSPYKMYLYYKVKNAIPDKIIYVDFGRTEQLSVEDADFPYNEFVEKYYTLAEDEQINQTFRIKLYVNNGSFDENYDYWIDQCR